MNKAVFKTRLLPDGHLYCPEEFAKKKNALFKVVVPGGLSLGCPNRHIRLPRFGTPCLRVLYNAHTFYTKCLKQEL
jgi:hypothetical protein